MTTSQKADGVRSPEDAPFVDGHTEAPESMSQADCSELLGRALAVCQDKPAPGTVIILQASDGDEYC